MSTLLLRLAAPLQAWGLQSKFDTRDTGRAPSKSAVIGLVAAALGLPRDSQRIAQLGQQLRLGVRIDRGGSLLRDYQTAKSAKSAYVTHRYYLSDALFLVGLEGEPSLLMELAAALQHPWFPLCLGRRSCPPAGRLVLGIRELPLLEALEQEPFLGATPGSRHKAPQALRLLLEAAPGQDQGYIQQDQPLSFAPTRRQYGYRRVVEQLSRKPLAGLAPQLAQTDHDAFLGLEDAPCT